jgi:hypothetical protein
MYKNIPFISLFLGGLFIYIHFKGIVFRILILHWLSDVADGGSSLLCYPSAALQKLGPCMDQSAIVSEQFKGCVLDILNRPVMSFLLQQHNLEALQLAMRQALRKAACRVYAMQVKCLSAVTYCVGEGVWHVVQIWLSCLHILAWDIDCNIPVWGYGT